MEDMSGPWTNSDLYFARLNARERGAVGAIAQTAYDYAVNYRYGWHQAWILCEDYAAHVAEKRQPLIYAHAVARHPRVAGVRTLLLALGADVDVADRIAVTQRRARRVERRPVRSVRSWTTQPAG